MVKNPFIAYRKPSRTLSVVDLFAGCGGLSLGLEYAGFTPVFFNELNPDARQTYLANRVEHDWLQSEQFMVDDVRHMIDDGAYLKRLSRDLRSTHGIGEGEIDLLVGGPPCQGFSGLGIRRSFPVWKRKIESNYLFDYMAKVIFELQPRVFLFENVKGLLSARWEPTTPKGEIWETVYNTFSNLPGYRVAASLVHAREYGVPQSRPRVLLVGVREDIWSANRESTPQRDAVALGFLPRGNERAPDLKDLLGDLVEAEPANGATLTSYPGRARGRWQRWFRSAPPQGLGPERADLRALTEHEFSWHSPDVLRKFELMHRSGGVIPEEMQTKKFAQRLLRPQWDPIKGPTITVTSLPDDFVHYSRYRTLTVREWARLQTFPDWYVFRGKRTTGGQRRAGNPQAGIYHRDVPKYTQIGNAVAVKLAYEVGLHVREKILAA